jgi:hypothetical protein
MCICVLMNLSLRMYNCLLASAWSEILACIENKVWSCSLSKACSANPFNSTPRTRTPNLPLLRSISISITFQSHVVLNSDPNECLDSSESTRRSMLPRIGLQMPAAQQVILSSSLTSLLIHSGVHGGISDFRMSKSFLCGESLTESTGHYSVSY